MALLRIENLCKNFGGLRALQDITFSVGSGEVLGIIGPNGAGKSTLFNVISGFEKPTSGEVFLGEQDISGLKPSAIARLGVVRTWQENKLVKDETVKQHVVLSCGISKGFQFLGAVFNTSSYGSSRKAMEEKAHSLLESVDLSSLSTSRAGELTHGQQRLLGIAMGLACEPRILMLDEPFTGMNTQEIRFASRVLTRIMDEVKFTLIMIEHNMRLVMGFCKRIIVLDHGIKIAEGSPAEVSANKDVIQAYLGVSKHAGA